MSTTSTTIGLPLRQWSVKQYMILIALVVALVGGAFAVYSLTGSETAASAPGSVLIEEVRAGGDGCSASFTVSGGLVEGQSVSNACGGAGGAGISGGVQP